MAKISKHTFIILAMLIVLLSSCNLPSQGSVNPATSVALTLTSVALSNTATSTLTPPPSATFTPVFTSTPAATATPLFPYVYLSVSTNCRTGPSKNYDLVDTFTPGQTIEVLAKDPLGEYWYVRSPYNSAVLCWMWGNYAQGGNLFNVAVYTPPPSPTPPPTFDITYTGIDTCVGWWPRFKLVNSGPVTFKSISYLVKDKDTDETVSDSRNSFDDNSGCLTSSTVDNLEPGITAWISTFAFTNDPAGHKLTASVKLCTNENQGGTCVEKTLNFTP